jgi:hypothetical protein
MIEPNAPTGQERSRSTHEVAAVSYEIRARSRLVPAVPITSPKFVYRRAGETDVRVTFARVRASLGAPPDTRSDTSQNPTASPAPAPVAEAPC